MLKTTDVLNKWVKLKKATSTTNRYTYYKVLGSRYGFFEYDSEISLRNDNGRVIYLSLSRVDPNSILTEEEYMRKVSASNNR